MTCLIELILVKIQIRSIEEFSIIDMQIVFVLVYDVFYLHVCVIYPLWLCMCEMGIFIIPLH